MDVAGVRSQSPGTDTELPDTALFWRWVGRATRPVVGWVLVGLGILLVLAGYLGVSRESIVAKQLPYLMSGGIGGLLITVVGAYFLGTEELRKDSGRLDRLEAMVADLHQALLSRPDAPAVATGSTGTASARNGAVLLLVKGGETVHQPSCPMVEGKTVENVTPAAVRRRGLAPCPLCEPALVDA